MLFLSTYPNPLRNHSSSVKKHHSFLKCNETYFVLSELLLVKLTLHMFAMHSHMIRSVKDKKVLLRTPNNPLQTNFWRPSVREGSKAPQPPPSHLQTLIRQKRRFTNTELWYVCMFQKRPFFDKNTGVSIWPQNLISS